jgi:hypothetical protein
MTRLNTAAEIWGDLTLFGIMWDSTSGLSGTLDSSGGIGKTASTFAVSVTATGSTGAYIRVGPKGGASVGQIEAGTTGAITLVSQVGEVKSSGAAVVELIRTDLGDIQDGGINNDIQADRNRIDAATQRHRYAWHIPHTDYVLQVGLLNLSIENLLVAMGIPESEASGAGTAADPDVADWDPELIDTITPVHFYAQGTRKDGQTVECQWWDCDFDPAKTFNMARGNEAPLTFSFSARWQRWLTPIS